MSKLVTGDGRTHLNTGLMRESLVSEKLRASTGHRQTRPMVNNVSMINIGGGSIMDRGKEAILPLVEAIVKAKQQHRFLIGVGGGARARHTQQIGMDLGLPIGGLARIVGGAEEQNRDILQFLLAPHGGITFIKDHFQDLQLFLKDGMIPICIGQPPYHFWEPPPKQGELPENGPDTGLFLMAELIGVEKMIIVKDVDGIFDRHPDEDGAVHIARISAQELLENGPSSLPVERELLHTMIRARLLREVQIINGLKASNLLKALNGKPVGTTIFVEQAA